MVRFGGDTSDVVGSFGGFIGCLAVVLGLFNCRGGVVMCVLAR